MKDFVHGVRSSQEREISNRSILSTLASRAADIDEGTSMKMSRPAQRSEGKILGSDGPEEDAFKNFEDKEKVAIAVARAGIWTV